MAKPFLHPKSSKYYARIKEWDTASQAWKWRNRALGVDDYDLAVELMDSLQATALAASKLEGKTVDENHIKSLVTSIYASAGVIITKPKGQKVWPSIEKTCKDYMSKQKKLIKARSHRTYITYLNTFYKWLGKNRGQALDWFDDGQAYEFYNDTLGRMTVKSSNERIKMISRVYKWARYEPSLKYPENPCLGVKLLSIKSDEKLNRLPFSLEEVYQIIDFLMAGDKRKKEWGRAAMVSSMTGARFEDAVTMHRDNIENGILSYVQEKTGVELTIPLVEASWRKILEKCDGYICPELCSELQRLGNSRLSTEFTALVSEAGVKQYYQTFKSGKVMARKTFHSFRHTLRTFIVSSGGSDAQADLILGHSGNQGKTYTHSEMKAMQEFLGKALTKKKGKAKKKKKAKRAKKKKSAHAKNVAD